MPLTRLTKLQDVHACHTQGNTCPSLQILGSRGPVLPPRSAAPLTIPRDVHFATEDRAHLRADPLMELRNGKFVSLAESVQKFQSKTPTRFHSKPRSQVGTPATNISVTEG
jgi:hypothetical protein